MVERCIGALVIGERQGSATGIVSERDLVRALAEAAAATTVFGRIEPALKARLIGGLRSRGRYVAMIGDGVNDLLPLRRAQLGLAMEGGSAAAPPAVAAEPAPPAEPKAEPEADEDLDEDVDEDTEEDRA